MTEDSATTISQAGDAGSREPAEGSVAAGEHADPTDAGQSGSTATGDAPGEGAAPQEPAEGPA
ncbi:hypothetical protein [Nakamurella deserti]|uniref:hypothetical protein n=1 Tax=Nakamurella deserti TaxID=2164074 RepID=UPI000DBE9F0E|nr:hypothetical protein [Nakamurella deserti]